MKVSIILISSSLLAIFLINCSGKHEFKEAQINSSKQDSVYLVNRNGDTLPTGKKIKVIKPSNHMNWVGRTFKPKESSANLFQEYHEKKSNEIEVVIASKKKFYKDSIFSKWDWKTKNDTTKHPEAIKTNGTVVRLKNTSRTRLAPPGIKEQAVADIQFTSIDQGLVSSNINDILFDSRGLTWIATDRGLVRYDGVYSIVYDIRSGMPSNDINCLLEGVNNEIWIGFGSGGFAKYDGTNLTLFDKSSCGFEKRINDFGIDSEGNLLIGTLGAGLCSYDGNEIKIYDKSYTLRSHKDVGSFSKDKKGNIWFINFGTGIWKYSDEGLKSFTSQSGIDESWITTVFIDSKNRKWLGGCKTDFFMIQENNITRFKVSTKIESFITSFIEDDNGDIWIGTTKNGLFQFNGEKLKQYSVDEGLSSNSISCLNKDEYGRIWAGTYDGGIVTINSKSFEYFRDKHGLPSSRVNGILERNGKMYYATDQGLVIQSGEDSLSWVSSYKGEDPFKTGLRSFPNHDVAINKKGVIFTSASNFGLARILPDMSYMRRLGGNIDDLQNPRGVAVDSNGVFYGASGENGKLFYFTDTAAYYWGNYNNFLFNSSTDVEVDQENKIWISSADFGVCVFDGNHWIYYTTNEGLSANYVRDIYVDNLNRVWVATNRGLDFIQNGVIHNVDLADGKYNLDVQSIIQDKDGYYWVGLVNGLVQLTPKKKTNDITDFETMVYSKNDGIANPSFLRDAMYISKNNRLYMGTEGGLLIKDLEKSGESKFTPKASLSSIDLNSKEIDFNRLKDEEYASTIAFSDEIAFKDVVPFYNYPKNLELPYDINHITFYYEGTYQGALHPQRLKYEYYLEGVDEEWILGTKEEKVDYRNIPYGNYTFHLRSFINRENPSEVFVYSFSIQPPWYHTWWARTVFVILSVLAILGFVKLRTRALLKRQKELEVTVEERTSELKQKHNQLTESHREIRESITYAKRIQNAILPPQKLVKEYIPQSFVIYKPKDVVAGDFYWMTHVENKILFAAADCTGHGVPGAMVSVICNGGLNRSVNEFGLTDPGKILDKTRELVLQEFEKSEEDMNDGMDIALCSLEGNNLIYAGANNSIWIIRKDSKEIEEIKADKQPIGDYRHPKPFTSHEVKLDTGDTFYIFSDGYVDQFGGERGKKYKSINFKRFLLSIQDFKMEEQRTLIDDNFEQWKNGFEQVDDVCVIGVRVE